MELLLRLLTIKTVRLRLIWFAMGVIVTLLLSHLTSASETELAEAAPPPRTELADIAPFAPEPQQKPSLESQRPPRLKFSLHTPTKHSITAHSGVALTSPSAAIPPPVAAKAKEPELILVLPDFLRNKPPAPAIKAAPEPLKVTVKKGDTFSKLLQEVGAEYGSIMEVAKSLKKHKGFNPAKVFEGQEITLNLSNEQNTAEPGKPIDSIIFQTAPDKLLVAWKDDNGAYAVREKEIPLKKEVVRLEGTIEGSLYVSARRQGVPMPVVGEIINAFSYSIDFQREIKSGDKFEVLLTKFHRKDGKPVPLYELEYAALNLGGDPHDFYRFERASGGYGYFNADGESIEKSLLKTPIDGARLSSGYGMRKHPILGYSKMHKGVDFAASRGVPIYAAGDAVVEYAGRNGSYGNYVRLRHNSKYKTVYAHASRIARGIKPGARVKQRQVIAYVGSTGRSTGPHLHFEIMKHGRQVNPIKVKSPPGIILEGKELADFKQNLTRIQTQLASLRTPGETEFAEKE